MHDPDRIEEGGIPDLPLEALLQIAEIDMEMDEVLRMVDEYLDELDDVDRACVIHLLRMAWITGFVARHKADEDTLKRFVFPLDI